MTFITLGKKNSDAGKASPGKPQLTYSGGVTIVSPDGMQGAPHIIVEAPQAPIMSALIDLSTTSEQALEVLHAQGRYIIDSVVVESADGMTSGVMLTLTTLDAARGGGRAIVSSLALDALSDRKAIVDQPVSLGYWLKAPFIYATVSGNGSGTARLAIFGRILELDDPESRTYGRRLIDRVG